MKQLNGSPWTWRRIVSGIKMMINGLSSRLAYYFAMYIDLRLLLWSGTRK